MNRACVAVGLSRATAYRRLRPKPPFTNEFAKPTRRRAARRLSDDERSAIITVLNSERFCDQPPREVYASLLSDGKYIGSWRTMYRVLHEQNAVRERRNHRKPKRHAVPRLEATAPNQVWTWDISKLATHATGVFLNLYVVLDLFSRYVVAWMIAERENSALAKQLFAEAIGRYGVAAGQLIVHQDRGAPMTAHGFTELLGQLGVDRSYSRPRVSNDNAFSESHFHTLKYQPDYPGRFIDMAHARRWTDEFFAWYNDEHHHTGLALFTPSDVYFGRVDAIAERRQQALQDAYVAHPERFVGGPPRVKRPPTRVLINPIDDTAITLEELLEARVEELDEPCSPTPRPSTTPVINLPGVLQHHPGGEVPLAT